MHQEKKSKHRIKLFIQLVRGVGKVFNREQCFSSASGLAYATILSLVPLLVTSFSIFTMLPTFNKLANHIEKLIVNNFVATSAQVIQKYLHVFIVQSHKLSTIGMLSLLVTAALLIITIEQAFNKIWQLKKHRNSIFAFFLYCGAIVFVPILIGVGFLSMSFIFPFILSLPLLNNILVQKILIIAISYIATYLAFVLLYAALPNCKVPLKAALSGALIAAILFEIAKHGFSLYVKNFNSYQMIYGALSLIPIFLVWLYISWLIVLCGVVVSYVVANYQRLEDI